MAGAHKPWSLTGSARAARDARVAAIRYMRTSPVELAGMRRSWPAGTSRGPRVQAAPRPPGRCSSANMGYAPPYPPTWRQASAMILTEEARYLSQADLYVITPQMLAVVAAAAQTLRYGDLRLLREDDLPGPSGVLVLPQPLRLRLPTGGIEEAQAYTWRLPWRIPLPEGQGFAGTELPAVRMSAYTSARRANADFRREVRRLGVALPPILLDCIWSLPLHAATPAQQHDQQQLEAQLRMLNHGYWEQESKARTPASETTADYAPGSVIDEDADGTFGSRFLYAFWRMCEQQIATITTPEPGHAARKTAAKARRARRRPGCRTTPPHVTAAGPGQHRQTEWHHQLGGPDAQSQPVVPQPRPAPGPLPRPLRQRPRRQTTAQRRRRQRTGEIGRPR